MPCTSRIGAGRQPQKTYLLVSQVAVFFISPHERRVEFSPPGEAPAAEAREESALARELAPDSALLDIGLDEPPADPARVARGAAAISEFWRHAPLGPGVYRVTGQDGEVLSVGKARSIKKRILSCTVPASARGACALPAWCRRRARWCSSPPRRRPRGALLLEANFIKQLKPRYNVLLRDDKSFPYILIAGAHEAPRHSSSTAARALGAGRLLRAFRQCRRGDTPTLNALQRAFLLRTCPDSYYENRTRPCLLYQIKRCSGAVHRRRSRPPITPSWSPRCAISSPAAARAIRDRLAREMSEAAEALAFEKARRACATASPRCR